MNLLEISIYRGVSKLKFASNRFDRLLIAASTLVANELALN